jgi:alginate O-acetyltransferase complex protein AlgI
MLGIANFPVHIYSFDYLFDAPGLLAFAAGVLFALPVPKPLKKAGERSEVMYLLQNILLVLLFGVSVVFMVNSTYNSFIYFQF